MCQTISFLSEATSRDFRKLLIRLDQLEKLGGKLTTHVVRTAGVVSVVRHQLLPVFTLRREQVTQALVTHCGVRNQFIILKDF